MATITPEELPELLRTLNQANLNPVTRSLIEWQLHTISRSNEAARAVWSEIDVENSLWIIPAERMKMKREHIVPLTKNTLNLLEILKTLKSTNSDYLFPSRTSPKKHINTETVNKVLR
jgi:integrase